MLTHFSLLFRKLDETNKQITYDSSKVYLLINFYNSKSNINICRAALQSASQTERRIRNRNWMIHCCIIHVNKLKLNMKRTTSLSYQITLRLKRI
jgi:hypothetical protein